MKETVVWTAEVGEEVEPLNSSGLVPTEFKLLLTPKPVEEKRGSLIIPQSAIEAEKYQMTEGTIIGMSHLAFTYATAEEWGDHKPKIGQRVIYARNEGVRVKGADGVEYLLINDKSILAVMG